MPARKAWRKAQPVLRSWHADRLEVRHALRFHFYSDEGNEPAHIHIRTNDGECEFWLVPAIVLAQNRGVRPADLRRIEPLVFEHRELLTNAFNEYHRR
jgi:hypothetical protein